MRWIKFLALCLAIPLMISAMGGIASAQDHDQTIQTLLAEARASQARGDFAQAAEAYRKAVALDPSIPELWANLGLMDHEAGNHSEAISSFQRAIRLNSSLFVPQLFLGVEYLQANRAEAALPHLESAAKLNPKDIQALRSLAETHATLGEIDKAIDLYWQAMRLNSNEGSLWFDLGSTYLQQVENDARLMTSAYSDSAYVKLRSAEVLATEGKLTEAEMAYKGAIALTQPLPCPFAELGITLLRQQETSAAQKQFERELQVGYHCEIATLGLAVSDLVSSRPEDAVDKLISVAHTDLNFVRSNLPLFRSVVTPEQVKSLIAAAQAKESDSSPIDLTGLIESAFSSDDFTSAWLGTEEEPSSSLAAPSSSEAQHLAMEGKYSSCSQALKSDLQSENANRLQLLAFCSFYAADLLTTSRAAQKLKKDPGTRLQGLYWESRADQNLAVQALGRAGEIDANSPRMHVLLGDVFRQQHHWDEAEAEYRKAIVLDPNSHSARLSLAITLFTELKYDEALSLDESLLSENAADPEANLLAAEILVQRNQFREAEPYLLKCESLKAELLPRSHALLGKVYGETDRLPAAIAEYKLGLSTDADGSIHYQLARLYQKSGNRAAAVEAFRESKRLVDKANNRERTALGQTGTDERHQ
jgi:tetratricopeptide (TPR) repeat protein